MSVHREVRPHGVVVESSVPFIEARWWDHPALHIVFSWSSWASMILEHNGYPRPRRAFKRVFAR